LKANAGRLLPGAALRVNPVQIGGMVLQMSDLCIRDFLHQIDRILVESKWSVSKFIAQRVPSTVQNSALLRASQEKRDSVRQSGVMQPAVTYGVIDAFARITAALQTRSSSGAHLRSSERGKFVIFVDGELTDEQTAILDLVQDAAEAGYFRIELRDSRRMSFRVHTSLAACYGFSYRGAYYHVALGWQQLIQIYRAAQEGQIDDVVDQVAHSLGATNELPLFGE
jgi:hypothetical protein